MGSQSENVVAWRSICPVSRTLDLLGDEWPLLIVRDLLRFETRTYPDFRESPERISTNILAARLNLLTRMGVIEHSDPEGAPQQRLQAHGER